MSCSGHSHDHEHETVEETAISLSPSLVDLSRTRCLNEDIADSHKSVLKVYSERLVDPLTLKSAQDSDVELLFYIPFVEAVNIKSISISGPRTSHQNHNPQTAGPKTVKIFVNREDIDFSMAEDMEPVQELELVSSEHEVDEHLGYGTIDYPCFPVGRFQNVTSVTLYFPENFDGNDEIQTEISFIGFKGKSTHVKRKAVKTVYETIGMPEDNDGVRAGGFGNRSIL